MRMSPKCLLLKRHSEDATTRKRWAVSSISFSSPRAGRNHFISLF